MMLNLFVLLLLDTLHLQVIMWSFRDHRKNISNKNVNKMAFLRACRIELAPGDVEAQPSRLLSHVRVGGRRLTGRAARGCNGGGEQNMQRQGIQQVPQRMCAAWLAEDGRPGACTHVYPAQHHGGEKQEGGGEQVPACRMTANERAPDEGERGERRQEIGRAHV